MRKGWINCFGRSSSSLVEMGRVRRDNKWHFVEGIEEKEVERKSIHPSPSLRGWHECERWRAMQKKKESTHTHKKKKGLVYLRVPFLERLGENEGEETGFLDWCGVN